MDREWRRVQVTGGRGIPEVILEVSRNSEYDLLFYTSFH